MTNTDSNGADLLAFTASIVAAYVSNNAVRSADLPELIVNINSALGRIGHPEPRAQVRLVPAVPPKRSVFPDYIVSLENGQKFKMLKSHLRQLGMTPDQYRAKWRLPKNYPMVAPNYSDQRSAMAKASGLGRKTVQQ